MFRWLTALASTPFFDPNDTGGAPTVTAKSTAKPVEIFRKQPPVEEVAPPAEPVVDEGTPAESVVVESPVEPAAPTTDEPETWEPEIPDSSELDRERAVAHQLRLQNSQFSQQLEQLRNELGAIRQQTVPQPAQENPFEGMSAEEIQALTPTERMMIQRTHNINKSIAAYDQRIGQIDQRFQQFEQSSHQERERIARQEAWNRQKANDEQFLDHYLTNVVSIRNKAGRSVHPFQIDKNKGIKSALKSEMMIRYQHGEFPNGQGLREATLSRMQDLKENLFIPSNTAKSQVEEAVQRHTQAKTSTARTKPGATAEQSKKIQVHKGKGGFRDAILDTEAAKRLKLRTA